MMDLSEQELDARIRAFLDRKLYKVSKPTRRERLWNHLKKYFTYTPLRTSRLKLLK